MHRAPGPSAECQLLTMRACTGQELYRWPSVQEAGKKALALRYQLLPHMYTAFQKSHAQGTPVARPLFYHWPEDEEAHRADGQFLLGNNILVTPVLTEVGVLSAFAAHPEELL